MSERMTIGQVAAAAGVNVETVRYYQRRELLATPERPSGGIGRYSPDALTRLRFIKRSQSLGFSLEDVQALLSLDDGQSCTAARSLGERKLAEVRERIRALQALEVVLQELVSQCSSRRRKINCPLIEALMRVEGPLKPSALDELSDRNGPTNRNERENRSTGAAPRPRPPKRDRDPTATS